MRVWFNRAFSSVYTAIKLIREADTAGRFHIIYSNPSRHSPAAGVAHAFFVEPTGLDDAAYIAWCLATALATIHDKARFYAGNAETAVDGARVADCARFDTLAQFDAAHATLRPRHAALCVKAAHSDFGLGELGTVRTMLLMEYLDGHEYSVDCVGDNGRLVTAIARKKPLQAGGGLLRLLEINPRLSGGIGMACVAGPNLPWIALCGFADGFDGVAIPPVRNGIRVAELPGATELA
jgi:hypothetical protein